MMPLIKNASGKQYSTFGYSTILLITITFLTFNFGFGQVPTGYSVTIDQDPINLGNQTAVSFTFAGAEVGSTYAYTFSSDGGGTPVSDSGTIITATDNITSIDLSGLGDGTVTLSVTLANGDGTGTPVLDTSTKITVAPSGYSATIDQDPINADNQVAVSFTFAGAEVGSTYAYTFNSDGGGAIVTGSGTILTATDNITGINLSGLADGTVTMSVTLTNSNGTGPPVLDTSTKSTVVPIGYSVTIDQDPINVGNQTAVSFTFAGAEVGSTYAYTFSSDGGGTPVSDSGTIITATDNITGINISGLGDGTVTLSVTLANGDGTGAPAQDTSTKYTAVPSGYSVTIDQDPINTGNQAVIGFTFAGAEVGSAYSYIFTSDGGGTPISDNGIIITAADNITGIDLSGLADGTVTLSVVLSNGNGTGSLVTDTSIKNTVVPAGYSVTIDQDPINTGNQTAIGFTFAGAEIGSAYAYTFSSDGGGTPVSDSGTIVTATDNITGIDLSGLNDGTVTLSVTLTNGNGTGSPATDTSAKDTAVPSGYSVTIDQDPINVGNQTAVGFTFTDAEVGSNYVYTFSSDGGGTPVSGGGTILTSTDNITGIDLSGLGDGTVTLSVTLNNGNGTGLPALDTSTKESVIIEFSQASGSDAENSGGNLPVLLVTGTVTAPTTVTVTDVGTGNATSGVDYNYNNPQVVNIPAGTYNGALNTAIPIPTLSINGDVIVESNQTFNLGLSNPTGDATLGTQVATSYTISNDDSASVTLVNVSGNEDDGPITITATLDNPVDNGFTVQVFSNDASATLADNDYTDIDNLVLTFAGTLGETEEFDIIPTADNLIEADEIITITMGNLGNTSLAVDISDEVVITFNNDDSCLAGNSAPLLDNSVVRNFCDAFIQDLDAYTNSAIPTGSDLRWSTNSDTTVIGDFLPTSTVSDSPDTYYGFFYDALNNCASQTLEVVITQNFTPSTGNTANVATCNDSNEGDSVVDLDDQLTGADAGSWTLTSAPGGASITINASNIVNFNGQPLGDYTFTYTTTGAVAPCVDQSVDLIVTVQDCAIPCDAGSDAPILDTNESTTFCDTVFADLNDYVTSTAPAGSILTWSTNPDPLETVAHRNSLVNAPGSYFGFFYDSTNDCASPVLTVTLELFNTPTIDSTTGDTRCGDGNLDTRSSSK